MADNPKIEDLRRRVQRDPASIAFAQLAEEYRRAGQHQDAVDACCAGLVLHPGYLSARVTLGRALIELGDFDQAQRELETVLKAAPENLAAIRGIADVHHKRGAFVQALEFYRTALTLARNDPDLEQTVADLAQRVGSTKRSEPKDGLSLEQMQQEIAARVPPPTQAPAPPPAVPTSSSASALRATAPIAAASVIPLAGRGKAEPERAALLIAALEQWLNAIHVTRAQAAS